LQHGETQHLLFGVCFVVVFRLCVRSAGRGGGGDFSRGDDESKEMVCADLFFIFLRTHYHIVPGWTCNI
jgi:hypothetical protein